MLFSPFAGENVCRRVAPPQAPHGTPNMEPRHALDAAAWLWHPELAATEPGHVLFRLNFKSARAETVTLHGGVGLDIMFPRAGSPWELIAGFAAVRGAVAVSRELAGLID
jgi:hypothetical protein